MISITAQRPSSVLSELSNQLLEELRRLEDMDEHAEEEDLFRAYLRHFLALAWEGVARGNLNAPREALDHLLASQPFVDAHRPHLGPVAQAAIEIENVIRSFYLAVRVLALAQSEARLADRRSATEREVLRVLLESPREYLRRRDIHERITPEVRPTLGRVGQILADLYHGGLLKRIHGRAQGNPSASFYALSPRGLDVCRALGMEVPVEEAIQDPAAEVGSAEAAASTTAVLLLVEKAVTIGIDPKCDGEFRRLAIATVANSSIPGREIFDRLEAVMNETTETPSVLGLARETVTQVLLTKPIVAHPEAPGIIRLDHHGSAMPSGPFVEQLTQVASWEEAPLAEIGKDAVTEALRLARV